MFATADLRDLLAASLPPGLTIVERAAIHVSEHDFYIPDLLVVPDSARASDHAFFAPAEVLLAVEIAETTLNRDLGLKRQLYAEAGVSNYWVVDTARRVTHVFGNPEDSDYGSVRTVPFGEPLAVPGTTATILL